MLFKPLHPQNALVPMPVTPSGIMMPVKLPQLKNAPIPFSSKQALTLLPISLFIGLNGLRSTCVLFPL